jgi:amidophosphoribosyltransferase
MAREAGAKKVYFASCAPPIRYPNVYGIDMPSRHELVAYGRTNEQVAEEIGADGVIYLGLEELVHSVQKFRSYIKVFDTSVFDGNYITGGVDEDYMKHLEDARSDSVKSRNDVDSSETLGLHNHFYDFAK